MADTGGLGASAVDLRDKVHGTTWRSLLSNAGDGCAGLQPGLSPCGFSALGNEPCGIDQRECQDLCPSRMNSLILKLPGRCQPRWCLQKIEQLFCAEDPVALCAADFFDNALVFRLSGRISLPPA